MSSIFYDHLLEFDKLEKYVKKHVKTEEERVEIYHLIDEIVHHRIIGCILDRLPREHHEEFLHKFGEKPHDNELLSFLLSKIGHDVEAFIREEVYTLGSELLELIRPKIKKTS